MSWLKAGLTDDGGRYIPGVVSAINAMLVDPRVLTPGLRSQMAVAFNLPDHSIYSRRYRRPKRRVLGKVGRDWVRRPYPGGRRESGVYKGTVKPQHFRQWSHDHIGWTLYAISE